VDPHRDHGAPRRPDHSARLRPDQLVDHAQRGAEYHLWGRVPGGEIFGCTRDTTTVVADRSGTLATGHGSYGRERGALEVRVLHRPRGVDPVDGLAALPPGMADARLADAERERLLDPVVPPAERSSLLAFGIAVSHFGHGSGRATFRDITVRRGDPRI
jgi:hypothetical protein